MSDLVPIPLLSEQEIRNRRYELFGVISSFTEIEVPTNLINVVELNDQEEVTELKKVEIQELDENDEVPELSENIEAVEIPKLEKSEETIEVPESSYDSQIEAQRLQDKLNAIDEYYNKLRDEAKTKLSNLTASTATDDVSNKTESKLTVPLNDVLMIPTTSENKLMNLQNNSIAAVHNNLNADLTKHQLRAMMNSTIIDANYESEFDKLALKSMYCDDFETDELMAFLDPDVQNYHINCPNPYY